MADPPEETAKNKEHIKVMEEEGDWPPKPSPPALRKVSGRSSSSPSQPPASSQGRVHWASGGPATPPNTPPRTRRPTYSTIKGCPFPSMSEKIFIIYYT